jgi:NACHT conflict system protein
LNALFARIVGGISSFLAGKRETSVGSQWPEGMGVRRSEIEKALDDLVSNEAGFVFQSLGVILAKKRWPDLVASERKWDLGLDAYAPPSEGRGSPAMALACSLTASLDKIKSDATRIRENYADVRTLIFYTPQKVTRHTGGIWAKELRDTFDIELIVASREDLVTSLMDPANATLCATHLGIAVQAVEGTRDALESAREGSSEQVRNRLRHPRLSDGPRIQLRLSRVQDRVTDSLEHVDLDLIQKGLSLGRRFVLEAPAGAGKTTTLVHLAELTLQKGALCLILDLPGWLESDLDLLEFVARSPSFRSRGVDAEALARLSVRGHVDFLLNGWNEIAERHGVSAIQRLLDLERDFPTAGIILTTRPDLIRPPLPGSSLIRVHELNDEQRRLYLEESLGDRAVELLSRIREDGTLDKLTRNPLMLSEITKLFRSGRAVPRARFDILRAMSERIQDSEEHHGALQTVPLLGRADSYLSALAVEMTRGGDTEILDEDARRIVSQEGRFLQADGQLAHVPEPMSVLAALIGHHVLERVEYPRPAFRFQHNLFQEFFAALRVAGFLTKYVAEPTSEALHTFQVSYVNQPAWDESLRMIAEGVAFGSPVFDADPGQIGAALVGSAIPVDPVFAGSLAHLCGEDVWGRVRTDFARCVRRWFAVDDEAHRRCALAAMFASGSVDFADVIVPLLTNRDQQVRLSTYRATGSVHLSSLGADWRAVVSLWPEDDRSDFVNEVTLKGSASVAEELATRDPGPKIRAEALMALVFLGADDAVARVCEELSDETSNALVEHGVEIADLPNNVRPRLIRALRATLDRMPSGPARLRALVRAAKWGDVDAPGLLKDDLQAKSGEEIQRLDHELLMSAVSIVQTIDGTWADRWIGERIAEGVLWPDRWLSKLKRLDQALLSRLWEQVSSNELAHREAAGAQALLAKGADDDLLRRLLRWLYAFNDALTENLKGGGQTPGEIARQVTEVARGLPRARLVSGLLQTLSEPPTLGQLWTILGVLGLLGREESDYDGEVADADRVTLGVVLVRAVPFVLDQEDFGGKLKAELAMALARIRGPKSATDLRTLISADIERCRLGRDARARGERSPRADGAVISWSAWHTKAVTWLGAATAEPILLELLHEAEYEEDAALGLVTLVDGEPGPRVPLVANSAASLMGSRRRDRGDEARRMLYADAIAARIQSLIEQPASAESPELLSMRAKRLARVLASLDAHRWLDLVMRVMALPGDWDGWMRADALELLLRAHARLPTDAALAVLNPAIDHTLGQGLHDQQNAYLLGRFLGILAFLNDSARGIDRIRTILSSAPRSATDLRDLVSALGRSGSEQALDFLLDLARTGNRIPEQLGREWIDAVAAIDRPRSHRILASFVDPDSGEWTPEVPHDLREFLAVHIATLATKAADIRKRIFELCQQPLSQSQRQIIASVVGTLNTTEGLMAALGLIDDAASPPIPFAVERSIENALVERRPYRGSAHTYTLESRTGTDLRRRLFELVVNDSRRRKSAWHLLGEIEGWRLDYGKPMSEPRHPAIDSGHPWPPLDVMRA